MVDQSLQDLYSQRDQLNKEIERVEEVEKLKKTQELQDRIAERTGKSGKLLVYCQEWEESERGWGIRPDGYTLHLSKEDCNAYVKRFTDRQSKRYAETGTVPDEYTRTSGASYICEVSPEVYEGLLANKDDNGIGIWGKGKIGPKKTTVEELADLSDL